MESNPGNLPTAQTEPAANRWKQIAGALGLWLAVTALLDIALFKPKTAR